MQEGGLKAQFFSVFVQPGRFRPEQFFDEAQTQIDAIHKAVGASPTQIAMARTAADVRDNARSGKISTRCLETCSTTPANGLRRGSLSRLKNPAAAWL